VSGRNFGEARERAAGKTAFTIALLASICICGAVPHAARGDGLPPGFVRLTSITPNIRQDIRYAGSDNFVGRPIPGYESGECWLRREAAERLAQVEADLARSGVQLIVYDCYRPIRAVEYFVRWTRDPADQIRKAEHYRTTDKSRLLREGYIAAVSAHSKGVAVDVGLARLGSEKAEVDMGTAFDFFGPGSHTASPLISAAARQNRVLLASTMTRRGFLNYGREWWHFSLPESRRFPSFDVPIRR
jgi:D-alanyl-D-alanine dipeptidase